MLNKILIAIALGGMLIMLGAFVIFSEVHYFKDEEDKPEKIFMTWLGIFTLIVASICIYGILTS